MVEREQRIAAEIAHGRILRERNPIVWAWSTPAGERRGRRRAQLLAVHSGARAGARVLELGSGTGVFTRWFTDASGADVTGVDVSPDLVEEARRREPALRFQVADAHRLPFPDAGFDAVFASSTLHHLEADAALREVLRVLKPGARAVFAEPNLLNPQVFAQKRIPALRRRAFEVPHETAYVRWSLARRLRAAGFTGVRTRPFDFLHPLTPRPWIGPVAWLGGWLERVPLIREFAGSCLAVGVRPG